MSANKHQGIRDTLLNTHIATTRLHNNANILTMPARHLSWKSTRNSRYFFSY